MGYKIIKEEFLINNLYKLYPQYQTTGDRRQQEVPVAEDRRSGKDRRPEQRIELSSNIKKDLYEVKTDFEKTYAAFEDYKNITKTAATSFLSNIVKSKNEAQEREILNLVTSPIPMARRLVNIKNNKDNDNPIKAVGLTAIAAINAKEDIRDILSIFGKVKSAASKGYYAKYGFFVGTTVENWFKKFKFGKKILINIDKTVGEWSIIVKLFDKLKITPVILTAEKTVKHILKQEEVLVRNYVHLKGGKKITRLVGYTLHRMPQLSLLASGLLELPSIVKAKNKDKLKQIANSTLSVVCGATSGAFLSATAALLVPKMIGLPIMALGVGYYLGSKIAKAIGFKLTSNN